MSLDPYRRGGILDHQASTTIQIEARPARGTLQYRRQGLKV